MNTVDLLKKLKEKGIVLYLNKGRLAFKCPAGAMDDNIRSNISKQRDSIVSMLHRVHCDNGGAIVTKPRNAGDVEVVSFSQQRLWLLDKIDGGSSHYNVPASFLLSGALDLNALEHSFSCIIERHQSLRTCFTESDDGELSQLIQDVSNFSVQLIDLSKLQNEIKAVQVENEIVAEANKVFDLSRDLMLRVKVLKLAEAEHVVLITMHHIATDGWSQAILINEFCTLYSAYIHGKTPNLTPLMLQYADYANWQRNWLRGDVLEEHLSYWQKQLSGLPAVHSLPQDFPRPAIQTFDGDTYEVGLGIELTKNLNKFCQDNGATLFMGLHAAFSVLLSRYSNETDIVVGSPVANREQEGVGSLIGFFANTLVLRSDLSDDLTFFELLKQSQSTLLDAYAHQQVPFDLVVEKIQPMRSLSHSPLFQIMLILQNNKEGTLSLPELSLQSIKRNKSSAKFDLSVHIDETVNGLKIGWAYNTNLFNYDTIVQMAKHFIYLISSLLEKPDESVFKAEMLSQKDCEQQLVLWNNTEKYFPEQLCIHQLIEIQADASPDAPAVVFDGVTLSYGELNSKSNQLACYLVEHKKILPDTLVGVYVGRSLEMMICILAILKAGAAYVPLDPEYPHARLRYMADDANLAVVMTQSHLLNDIPFQSHQLLCLDDEFFLEQLKHYPTTNISPSDLGLTSKNLAYVIYTSGSTGRPKGVMVEHSSLVNSTMARNEQYGRPESFLLLSSVAFDSSVAGIFNSLTTGGKLCIANDLFLNNPVALVEQLEKQHVSHLLTTPSLYNVLLDIMNNKVFPDMVAVIVAGETCSRDLVAKHHQYVEDKGHRFALFNEYGPSEATVWATSIELLPGKPVSIGYPINNTKLYVVNRHDVLTVAGSVGELYIGGAGLARGYLNQKELTQEKFIANPFGDIPNDRVYKTGDLVRWTADGSLEFIGRHDHQVKVRGFRIELGEIEQHLACQSGVNEAIVIAKDSESGNKYLAAYLAVEDAHTLLGEDEQSWSLKQMFIASLRNVIRKNLPEHMVPSVFVVMDRFPLSANGKLDRNALPDPDITQHQAEYVDPVTPTQRTLCSIWQDVLGLQRVGIHDNFFELGGHSLLVMKVISKGKKNGLIVTAKQLFSTPLLKDLAAVVDKEGVGAGFSFEVPPNLIPNDCREITQDMLTLATLSAEDIAGIVSQVPGGSQNIQDIYPLAPLQQGMWFHHLMSESSDPYVIPVLFRIRNKFLLGQFIDALQFVIGRHDVLRTAILWQGLAEPVQIVCRQAELPIFWPVVEEGQSALTQLQIMSSTEKLWLDLSKAPLLQLQIAAERDDSYVVLLKYHHIIADHIGLEIIEKEIIAYLSGHADLLPAAIPFRDFVAYGLHQAKHHNAEAFFTSMLGDFQEPTLPFNLSEVRGDGRFVVDVVAEVPDQLSVRLRNIAKEYKVSPAVLFHAAWAVVISACCGNNDVVFGTVLSGRLHGDSQAENALGMFINTLPLRVRTGNIDVAGLISQVHQTLQSLLPYEQASLMLAQKCSGLPGSSSMFSSIINYRHSVPDSEADARKAAYGGGISLIGAKERTNYPFNLSVDDLQQGFALELKIDNAVDARLITSYLQNALSGLVESLEKTPTKKVSALSVLSASEFAKLVQWSGGAEYSQENKCIHQMFEAQVQSNPDAIALICDQAKLSYAELNSEANHLAHYLVDRYQVKPDMPIGVYLERSDLAIVALLAILKAGGAYVPLDLGTPEVRLKFMLEDTGLNIILTNTDLAGQITADAANLLCLDEPALKTHLKKYPNSNLTVGETRPCHLAYINYTSGSTGYPKGVMVEHTNVISLVNNTDFVELSADTVMLHNASLAFDAITFEVWGALLNGGTLAIQKEAVLQMDSLAFFIDSHKVTTAWMTAGLFDMFVSSYNKPLPTLKHLLVGGDIVSLNSVRRMRELNNSLDIINGYGPTENTTFSTTYLVPKNIDALEALPIGKPLTNRNAFVLSPDLSVLPPGVTGQLYVGGAGIARGYLNRPDLTAASYITNLLGDNESFSSCPRLYKTGDLACWKEDGNLMFAGRIDHQVKIRGFRIELDEIQKVLVRQTHVSNAYVLVKGSDVDKQLVAYILPVSSMPKDSWQDLIYSIRHGLKQELPEYMIPSAFVFLDSFPLTSNGKLDRKALPEPVISSLQVEALNTTDRRLCQIWQNVLNIKSVGISDNFFDLGGHSLSATRLVAQINEVFGISLPLKMLFEFPTIEALSPRLQLLEKQLNPTPLYRVSRAQKLPLSFAQQRLWILAQIESDSSHYNIPGALRLRGALDIAAFESAFQAIVLRHESLRTNFVAGNDGQPFQVIREDVGTIVKLTDLSLFDGEELQTQLQLRSQAEAKEAFDLESDLMLRVELLTIGYEEYIVLVTLHHIAADGWSMGILVNELCALYREAVTGESAELLPLNVQYADYANWQRNWLTGDVLEKQLNYWIKQLADLPSIHGLLTDNVRRPVQNFSGKLHCSQVCSPSVKKLSSLCQEQGATLFMGLHAAFSVLLARYSHETDIVMGSVIANREQAEVGPLIGFFANNLVLRSNLSGNPGFKQLLAQCKQTLLDAYANQQVPFELLVERIQPVRSLSHSPLFQVMLVLQNNEKSKLELPGITLSQLEQSEISAKFDLTINVTESAEGLTIGWEYNKDLFNAGTISSMAEHFNLLLESLLKEPERDVFAAPMLTDAEVHQQLVVWNETQTEVPSSKCIHELFERWAIERPAAVALIIGNTQYSYAELNNRANSLARYLLRSHQLSPGTMLGVYTERSLFMFVAILAILKSGCAYVPIEPTTKTARLDYVLADSGIKAVLTQQHLRADITDPDISVLLLDAPEFQSLLSNYLDTNIVGSECTVNAENLAYVIYTSGSTGRPKGCLLRHKGLVNLSYAQSELLHVVPSSRVLQFASIAFDASTWEWCMALTNGAALVLATKEQTISAGLLSKLVADKQVTHATIPPVLLPHLEIDLFSSVSTLIVAGDTCSKAMADLWSVNRQFINAYGPTETTVCATLGVYRKYQDKLHIGKPLPNVSAYVLNNLQLVPVGVPGELYIGGVNLAQGYLQRPELTEEKFILNPFFNPNDKNSSFRLYRTGDLVCSLPDGSLQFLGRTDHQIKINGYRIEIGEVEHALAECSQVAGAVVIVVSKSEHDKQLIAYVVPSTELDAEPATGQSFINSLRQNLRRTLPEYMIPAVFVLMDALPLNQNGKVDHKQLPQPVMLKNHAEHVSPVTTEERILSEIWQDVLSIERVSCSDNFFELGGNSLKVIQMISAARKAGLNLEMSDLLKYQTIEQLSESLQQVPACRSDVIQPGGKAIEFAANYCRVEVLYFNKPVSETYLRHALKKLLSDERLSYRARQHEGRIFLEQIKRSRKEYNALWQIFDENSCDRSTFADIQTERLCKEILSLELDLVGLAYLNHSDGQICVIAAHELLVQESDWKNLCQAFNERLQELPDVD